MNITSAVSVGAGANQYYGTLIVSGIKYEDGSAVSVDKTFNFTFHSPVNIVPTYINPSFSRWQDWKIETSNQQIAADDFLVSVTLTFPEAYTFSAAVDTITIGVNGDLASNPQRYTDSFSFAADGEVDSNGEVIIRCAAAPDEALSAAVAAVSFTLSGGQATVVDVALNGETSVKLPATTWQVTTGNIANAGETVVAEAMVNPQTINLAQGQTTEVGLTFGQVTRYSSVNFRIADIAQLADEVMAVKAVDQNGETVVAFTARTDELVELRYLPEVTTLTFTVEEKRVNNNLYSFSLPAISLVNDLVEVVADNSYCTITPVDVTAFSTVDIALKNDSAVEQEIFVRLQGEEMSYTATLSVSGHTKWPVKVKPGKYVVTAGNFIVDKTVYVVISDAELAVEQGIVNTLTISVEKSAHLMVPGFPEYLSFGGLADMTPTNADDFAAARISSIFKYAGNDGAGDSGGFLADDPATTRTIEIARAAENQLGGGHKVLPVMISYTCNLSGGNARTMLANGTAHTHSFANFILSMNIAKNYKDDEHPVPACFVVNADLIGACQQDGITSDHQMPVREPLSNALAHHNLSTEIPAFITENLRGYVQAVNWLVNTLAPELSFGWVVNLWGVGKSQWIYDDTDTAAVAKSTVDYVDTLGVFEPGNAAHFMAVDRYEADDLTIRSYGNSYCYGPKEWQRYYQFCAEVSHLLKMPVMPWQIPASRTPLKQDAVYQDFDTQNWGTSANYLLGDSQLAGNVEAINDTILDFAFPAHMAALVGTTPRDMFNRAVPFDLSEPACQSFPLKGIFTVLLGGGSTTGVISTVGNPDSWVRSKLNAYMDSPVAFE